MWQLNYKNVQDFLIFQAHSQCITPANNQVLLGKIMNSLRCQFMISRSTPENFKNWNFKDTVPRTKSKCTVQFKTDFVHAIVKSNIKWNQNVHFASVPIPLGLYIIMMLKIWFYHYAPASFVHGCPMGPCLFCAPFYC